MGDYRPEAAELDHQTFPALDQLADWLGGTVDVEAILTPRDTPDWSLASFWAHPERLLDEAARNATSAFARMDPAVVNRVVPMWARNLRDGSWDQRHGHPRGLHALDVGMGLVVGRQ